MLQDSHGRSISYLRVSLTDRCNLRCRYCMPDGGVHKLDHGDVLSYEEILRVAEAAAVLGMNKLRLTGGEPLVRRGVVDFISRLTGIPGINDLRLTTNGVLLPDMADDLLKAGVRRINISLDSLNPAVFKYITGRDEHRKVMEGLDVALSAGFEKIKINCVVIRGINDNEIPDLASLARDKKLDIRFIEFMPLGHLPFWSADKFMSTNEIKDRLKPLGELIPLERKKSEGPARVFQWPGALGQIGFISPLSDHFCSECNRLRLTADGKLRLCLFSDREIDMQGPLRDGMDIAGLARILHQSVLLKPKGHNLGQENEAVESEGERFMNLIGG